MRHLGIDYGTKKIGLALSDEAGTMGFPHAVIPAVDADTYVLELIRKEGVEKVVIGESTNFAGEKNPVAKEAKAFGDYLEQHSGVSVVYEPEMLTTQEARRQHDSSEKTRTPKSHAPVDASAAALILTSYLSRHDTTR